ncbi:hypothetical protein E0485_11520 [Paenibacillus albiflavus]|uniref:DUF2231 domain-containing protein n=1 Tax=Paenibacillus albiflavus TaxID=2545760 RepID=A0A4R4EG53_9BACL|nr:DUF2231 domain-containing protein [Paenibacillus albiflavus]TCZ77088.1 hypothetical protein E0485_11520 [Paenibacillus albiflavus]
MSTPLHPLIVHFPIALLFIGAILQLAALWKPKMLNNIANIFLISGFVTGIFAYMTGDGGERFARQVFGTDKTAIGIHEKYAMLTLLVFGLIVLVKLYQTFPLVPRLKKYAKYSLSKFFIPVLLVLSLAGGTLVFLTGHYGGELVYHDSTATTSKVNSVK